MYVYIYIHIYIYIYIRHTRKHGWHTGAAGMKMPPGFLLRRSRPARGPRASRVAPEPKPSRAPAVVPRLREPAAGD